VLLVLTLLRFQSTIPHEISITHAARVHDQVRTFGDGNVKTYFKLTQWYVGTLPPHPSTNYTPPEILGRIELEVAVLSHQEDWLPIYWFLLAVVPETKPTTSLSSVAALIHDKVILQKDSENCQHLGIREL